MDPESQRVKLNDGHFIPVLGFGTYEVRVSEALEATKLAIEVGFRHVDSAHLYQNEEQVGQAIRSKIADGTVKREDVFYTSKVLYVVCVCTYVQPGNRFVPKDESGKLIFDSVDLCHTWEVSVGRRKPRGGAMRRKILCKPSVVECHPYLNQSKLLEFCKSHDIVLVAYAALGSQLSSEWVNQNHPVLLEDPVLCAIHKQTPALVALRYQVQRGVVVLAKSFNKKRIKENMQVIMNFCFSITSAIYIVILCK
uniref:NADP-dependent oxidoreductase domain-containing protein n=1 Tax=Capra hircus TaxID=9925 RepID=A0A8C2RM16_CAPHI